MLARESIFERMNNLVQMMVIRFNNDIPEYL